MHLCVIPAVFQMDRKVLKYKLFKVLTRQTRIKSTPTQHFLLFTVFVIGLLDFVLFSVLSLANVLKELRHDILSHFFDGLSHSLSVKKPKTYGLLTKEKTKGVTLKQKGTRMAEDGED